MAETQEVSLVPSLSPSEPQTPMDQLVYTSTTILQQAVDLVSNVLREDDQLTFQSKMLPGSTIGKHLRHAKDHFELLIACMSRSKPYVLNYDVRGRNVPMESSRSVALSTLKDTIQRLKHLQSKESLSLDDEVTLEAVTPYAQIMQTSFGRELWFASLHAIHHWSMIRLIAAGEMGIELDPSFGVAPSTLQHRGQDGLATKARI